MKQSVGHRTVWSCCMVLVLASGCGGGGSSYESELKKFNAAARPRIDGFAQTNSGAYLEWLVSDASTNGLDSFVEAHRSGITDLQKGLCDEVLKLAKKAGSGDTKVKRIEQVQEDTTRLIFDRVEFSVLRSVLERPAAERDSLLGRLGIRGQGTGGAEASGLEALRGGGLVDAEGHFTEPASGTPEYDRYSDWNDANPGFNGQMIALSGKNLLCDY